jgi:methionyl-tRNA formyltransferase
VKDIVIYLNGERGLVTLEAIAAAGHRVASVVVPAKLKDSDVAKRAGAAAASVEAVSNVNDPEFVAALKLKRPRLGLVAGFSTIFKAPLIGTPELGTLNLHGGKLPQYRGGSPLNWQIINGEKIAGISVIRVDQGIDTGPVLAEAEFPIGPDDTIRELHEKANKLFPGLVLQVLKGLDDGTLVERPQDETKARYWRQRKPNDGRLRWRDLTATQAYNLVRAITRPYPGAFTVLDGKMMRIFAARIADGSVSGSPGDICAFDGSAPVVSCAEGALALTDYDVEGIKSPTIQVGTHLGGNLA